MQIRSVVLDIGVDAVKTGMLSNAGIISRVAFDLKDLRIENVVVDPVMVAKGGTRLLKADALDALVSRLFPRGPGNHAEPA